MQTHADPSLTAFIQAYIDRQTAMDWRAIVADWDDDETVFYIAEEIDDPIIGRTAIGRYWAQNTSIMHRLGVRIGDIRARPLGPGLTAVLFPLHWNAVIGQAAGQALAGDVKVVAVLRQTDRGWRFCQWTESALGPLPFLRRVYQRAVDPGFAD